MQQIHLYKIYIQTKTTYIPLTGICASGRGTGDGGVTSSGDGDGGFLPGAWPEIVIYSK